MKNIKILIMIDIDAQDRSGHVFGSYTSPNVSRTVLCNHIDHDQNFDNLIFYFSSHDWGGEGTIREPDVTNTSIVGGIGLVYNPETRLGRSYASISVLIKILKF